jgi:hypothetical protein
MSVFLSCLLALFVWDLIKYIVSKNEEKFIEIMAQILIWIIYLIILWVIIALFGWEIIIVGGGIGFIVYAYYKISPKIKEYTQKITKNKIMQDVIFDIIMLFILFLITLTEIAITIYLSIK